MTYPDILLRPTCGVVYAALCAAGSAGATHEMIAERAGWLGEPLKIRSKINHAFLDIRSALKAHGLTVHASARNTNKPVSIYTIVSLASTDDGVSDSSRPVVTVIAGIPSYDHCVGPEFDTCGSRVRLAFIPSLFAEARA